MLLNAYVDKWCLNELEIEDWKLLETKTGRDHWKINKYLSDQAENLRMHLAKRGKYKPKLNPLWKMFRTKKVFRK